MEPRKLLIGPQIRRIRRQRRQTQADMAASLGVSPSYVNLIERNQRPVSADLLLRMAAAYDLDLAQFTAPSDVESDLIAAFQDPLFVAAGVTRADAVELAGGNPVLGEAVAALYRAFRASRDDLLDARASGRPGDKDPVEEARDFVQSRRNHFPPLDAAGEAFAASESAKNLGSAAAALAQRFAEKHAIRVRILPADVMGGATRRLDRHARELRIAESLDGASRQFQLALQL
ncbi:MAG: helix-turn-helix domain-containing protein, partial [Parvularculaceae bacterium]|nr:helix-turn-helix domain-containing protein [Parvularculaceae bacterium]